MFVDHEMYQSRLLGHIFPAVQKRKRKTFRLATSRNNRKTSDRTPVRIKRIYTQTVLAPRLVIYYFFSYRRKLLKKKKKYK